MKNGISLMDLAAELTRQQDTRRDFIADTRTTPVMVKEREETVEIPTALEMQIGDDKHTIRPHALRQIGERLKIPAKYVDRLAADHPDMLAYNINALFSREPESRMIRTLDGNVRAFLSDKYRPLDNFDLANATLPHLATAGAEIQSCNITESKLYIKAIRADLKAELPPPPGVEMGTGHNFFVETVQAGLTISNSEIGVGRLAIQPGIFTERCSNLATFTSTSFFKVHLGRKIGGQDESVLWEVLSDKTKELSDAAIWGQVNDLTTAAMDGTLFKKICDDLIKARTDVITKDVPDMIELTQNKFGFTKEETGGILAELIQGGDLSRYGLHAAVTRHSQNIDDYDRASELEAIGGKVIELKPTEWAEIAKAA